MADLREEEKRLLVERARRIVQWSADVDVVAMREELCRLRHEVIRLHDLLIQHDIDPGDTGQPGAGNVQTG